MNQQERLELERRVSKIINAKHPLHLFAGIGTARLVTYLVCHERLSLAISCEPVRQKGGLVTGASFLVGIFNKYDQRGFCETADFHEALTIAACQALDILPQVGQKVTFGRRPGPQPAEEPEGESNV